MIILTKLKKLLCTAFTVAAGILSTPTASQAALQASESDLFLCFRATGGLGASTDYIVNIGPASQFLSAAGSIPVDTGANGRLLTDLNAIYGTDWNTRADVAWSISGVQKAAGNGFPTNTMFASRAQEPAGTPSAPWIRPSAFGASSPALKMFSMRDPGFITGTTETGSQTESGTKGLIQGPNAVNRYSSFLPGGANTTGNTAFGYFGSATTIEGNFGSVGGTAASILDIYQLIPASGGLPAVRFGSFQLNNNAELTFTSGFTTQAQFASASASVNEDAGNVTVTINRGGDTSGAFSLNFSTASGTAVDGTDFTGQTNVAVPFAAGETSKTVNVAVINRAGFQGNRSFTATITVGSGAVQVTSPATIGITIVETAPEPPVLALSAATFSVAENVASGNATVTVSRTGPTDTATSVSLSTTDGTALAGTDYTAQTNAPVNFAVGEATKNVDIPITNRAGFQDDRAFTVTISNPTNGATLGLLVTATVTIEESDPNPAGTIAFSASTYETTSGAAFNVTLNRTLGTTGAVDVTVTATGGTLTLGEDFTLNPPVVSFADGQATAAVTIQFTPAVGPLPGNINLQLSGATNGASVGTPSTATVNVASTQVTLVSGSYTGLIVPTGETPPANDLHNASGLLTVKISSNGNFSGKALIGGATLPFAGKFNPDGTASFKPGSSATFPLIKKGKAPVTFGNLALSFDGGDVAATIGEIAVATADRAAFDGKTNSVDPRFLVNKGKYTCFLPSKEQDGLLTTEFPQGHGIGNITVTKQGKFTFKGRLADGTPLTMSGPLASNYSVPLYAALYAKKGSIAGKVTLDDTAVLSDLSGADFLWLRPAQTKAPVYLAGWPAGAKIDLFGATYAVSKTESVVRNLGPENPTTGNAEIQFASGTLTSDQNLNLNISLKNKVTNVPATDKTRKVTISAATGAVTGFFLHTDTKKTSFRAIVYQQEGSESAAIGYFLSVPVKNGPAGQSGSVVLTAK